ncbi:MAG: lipopolysaccharide biosynthesis protein [Mangrovibacterium sp.]
MDSKTIIKSLKWASVEFAIGALFRFFVKLLLAKLLLPDDFGLIGMTSIFIAVVSAASELGMGAALIQKKDNYKAERLYDTAFWTGVLWGIGLYLVMCLAVGPLIAKFYDEPILVKLIPVLSIGILLKPLNLVHIVILTRSMNFKRLAMIQNSAALIAGLLGILAAFLGFGVWALAIDTFLTALLSIPLLFLSTKWMPKLEWHYSHFKEIFSFGMYSTGTAIFSTTTYNIDNLMIGKMMGAGPLGAYTLAFSLTEMLRQTISSILNKVMYPVFGQLQDNKERLKGYFLKIVKINAITIYPLMTYFILEGGNLIIAIFGDKWEAAIIPLKILSLAVMVHLLINSFASLLRGLGHPGLEFKIILATTIFVLVPSLYLGISNWGLIGASIAILLNKMSLVIVACFVLNRYIKITLLEIVSAVKGAILSIGIGFILAYAVRLLVPNIHWTFISMIYFLSYGALLLYFEKEELKLLATRLKNAR